MKSLSELPEHSKLRRLWKQERIDPPVPDLELTPDHWVERGAEAIGWSLARFEYWLCESGWLRAWLRLNLFLSIVLTSAGILVLPPVTKVLGELAKSSSWLAFIVEDVFGTLTALPPVAVSVGVLYLAYLVLRRFRRQRLGQRGQEGYYQ